MNKVYQLITENIIKLLEKGTIPWKKGFQSGTPRNYEGRQYSGVNKLILMSMPYSSPYWLTFNQIKKKGGKVKKGEKGIPIVFWKPIVRDIVDPATNIVKLDEEGKPIQEQFFMLRYYIVFNLQQTEGLKKPKNSVNNDNTPIEIAEGIVAGYKDCPPIVSGKPSYSPSQDIIRVPPIEQFDKAERYYAVLFHEMGHSTGSKKKLNRKGIVEFDRFGSDKYSEEELIAEIASAFLCGECNITKETIDNQASYIEHWKSKLEGDNKLIFRASSKAEKAVKYIKGENKKSGED